MVQFLEFKKCDAKLLPFRRIIFSGKKASTFIFGAGMQRALTIGGWVLL